jgi:hypothetical protein
LKAWIKCFSKQRKSRICGGTGTGASSLISSLEKQTEGCTACSSWPMVSSAASPAVMTCIIVSSIGELPW